MTRHRPVRSYRPSERLRRVLGTTDELTLWPAAVFEELRAGSLVGIDFHGAKLRVTAVEGRQADAIVVVAGRSI